MMRFSKPFLVAAVLAVGALTLAPTLALGSTSGAHFFSASASVADSGALLVSWDEAGLGNQNVTYTLTADSSATYACINGRSKNPSASNKRTVSGQVSTGGSFQSKNGRVSASLTTGPLSPGSFTCPSGQTLVLAAVSYSNIVLTDTTNSVTEGIGSVSRTFVNLK
jgi:hypothetical protein